MTMTQDFRDITFSYTAETSRFSVLISAAPTVKKWMTWIWPMIRLKKKGAVPAVSGAVVLEAVVEEAQEDIGAVDRAADTLRLSAEV